MVRSRKESISACAARLFRKRGYQATSMRDIAEAESIKAASIYNHFKSKQEILSSLLLRMARLFTQGMQTVKTSGADPVGQLEQLIRLHVRLTIEHTDAIALIAGEWIHLEEPHLQEYRRMRDSYEAEFKEILNEGKQQGLLRDLATDIALFSMLSSLRWLYSWYSRNRDYPAEKLEEEMIATLLGGIKA
ncbi:TetR/AcrR family transcriptional regulator [Flavilitoribacter nigricans]|nr:TetR/AcrR family transcriptional regulator [Flavilitoribacter nigricans]